MVRWRKQQRVPRVWPYGQESRKLNGLSLNSLHVAAVFGRIESYTSFLPSFACRLHCSSCSSRAFWFRLRTDGPHHVVFLELLLLLAGASVFEGEFRDSGLVQLAFAECNELQILIEGRLS